jgi:hypothetical protein
MPERFDPDMIAADLNDCRQRGLDWLNHNTSRQDRVPAATLERLAGDYVTARNLVAPGRIAQIKILLRDGIEELLRQDHAADANLLRDLFFGDSTRGSIRPAGELLKRAREKVGDTTETRFRERRAHVMRAFAQFLIEFSGSSPDAPEDAVRDVVVETYPHPAVTGHVGANEHFIRLLAEAVNVTIVGITNERLTPILQQALRRKRAAGQPDAFWGSLRIVFLGKDLLHAVNDEREVYQDSREALRQRRQEAVWARRSLMVFLKRSQSTRWTLYDYPYLSVLSGAMLEFRERKSIAHLLIRRPRWPTADHLFIDMEDLDHQYFSQVFEDIVHDSKQDLMIVPVGVPTGDSFRCIGGVRLQSNVLKDNSDATGWLPMYLVITFRRRDGHAEAMLQLRTDDNSARELSRLSHLTGHILQEDVAVPDGRPLLAAPASFDLTDEIPLRAAQRWVREVTGDDEAPPLRPVATGSYLHPDKEHLFFFIFALELPEGTQFPRRAEMHAFPLPELLAVRANQALRTAVRLCQTTGMSQRLWTAAAEIVALNLSLHDHADLGEKLVGVAGHPAEELASMAEAISQLITERTTPSWAAASREVQLTGMAGWQYREFFSVLLPLYAELGIHGAADLLDLIRADSRKSEALAMLAKRYQDEDLMPSIPIEV